MRQFNRLMLFLLLNILVSAGTTVGVLLAWDQLRAPLPGGLLSSPLRSNQVEAPAETPEPTLAQVGLVNATPTPTFLIHAVVDGDTFDSIAQTYRVSVDDLVRANGYTQAQVLSPGELLRIPVHPVIVDSVVGASDIDTEHVIIQSNVNGELSLAGWQLDDSLSNVYTFPQVTIFIKGGSISLFTKAGADTATELYWSLPAAIWQTGKTVRLLDQQGAVQATYTIP